MKRLFLFWGLALILCFGVFAYTAFGVTLAWDANTDSAIGYKVYYQQVGGVDPYSEIVQGRENTTCIIDNNKFQPDQEYEFWVTAFNDADESGASNIVFWTAPIFIPVDNPAPVIIQVPGTPQTLIINLGG